MVPAWGGRRRSETSAGSYPRALRSAGGHPGPRATCGDALGVHAVAVGLGARQVARAIEAWVAARGGGRGDKRMRGGRSPGLPREARALEASRSGRPAT